MKRVLLIGGSGFLGRHLLHELGIGRYQVYALEHKQPLKAGAGITVIRGGLGTVTPALIREIKPDVVFHTGRPTFPGLRKAGRMMAARYAYWLNKRLLNSLAESGLKPKLVFASGSLMYGSSTASTQENSPLNPLSFARQYYRGEMPVLRALEQDQLPVMIFRIPWILANGSWFRWFYLEPMKRHRAIPLFGEGGNHMEILDIRDAARIMIRYTEQVAAPGIVNLLSAGPITQSAFASKLSDASGLPVKDYREVFPGKIEKAAMEAFTSNIILDTVHGDFFKMLDYTPLDKSLEWILAQNGSI